MTVGPVRCVLPSRGLWERKRTVSFSAGVTGFGDTLPDGLAMAATIWRQSNEKVRTKTDCRGSDRPGRTCPMVLRLSFKRRTDGVLVVPATT